MPDALLTMLGGVLVAGISGLAMVWVSRMNTRGASKAATIPPYDKLAQRLTDLEAKDEKRDVEMARLKAQDEDKGRKLATLQDNLAVVVYDRDSLVAYVKQWSTWFASGGHPPPPPVPSHLRDLLDPGDWEVAHITEHTTTTTRYTSPALPQPDDDAVGP